MATPEAQVRMHYEVFRASDADEMVQLLGEVFAKHDPPAIAAGLTPSDFEGFVRLLCPNASTSGLTIVARAVDAGQMAGVLLAEDSASAAPEGMDRLSPKFLPIFDILGRLETAYRGGHTVKPGESLHLFLLGVSAQFGGRGVAGQLVAQCMANGAQKGYRVAVTEATNRTSQHLFRKHGFVERARQSYRDHRYAGEAVFSSIAEQGGPMLMDKPLAQ